MTYMASSQGSVQSGPSITPPASHFVNHTPGSERVGLIIVKLLTT